MIDRIENQPIRLDHPKRTRKTDADQPPAARARPTDTVEISEQARERALAAADEGAGLSPERLSEIRQRIADGAYDSPEVLDRVARAMIERGDV